MNSVKVDKVLDKINELTLIDQINESDLLIDGESVIDVVLNMSNNVEEKNGLLSDLIMLDVEVNRKDEFFYVKLLETENTDLLKTIIQKREEDQDFKLDILRASMSDTVSSKTFSFLNKKFGDTLIENSKELLEKIISIKQENNNSMDKTFVLLLANDKSGDMLDPEIVVKNIAKNANSRMLKVLLSSKIDFNVVNHKNENAFFYVDGNTPDEMNKKITLMKASGINENILNIDGLNPKEVNKNFAKLETLSQNNKDVTQQNKRVVKI